MATLQRFGRAYETVMLVAFCNHNGEKKFGDYAV